MKKIVITYAVKGEYIPLKFEGYQVISVQTGVGKTKSTYNLTKKIMEERPDFVLNVGTAGTVSHCIGDIFVATHFVDRDYEAINRPGIIYEIEGKPLMGGNSQLLDWISAYPKLGVCNTGDTFVTQIDSLTGDFVDMEGFSQAFVCQEMGIPFLSVKYITDRIGENSVEAWENKLADAREALSKWFEEHRLLSVLLSK